YRYLSPPFHYTTTTTTLTTTTTTPYRAIAVLHLHHVIAPLSIITSRLTGLLDSQVNIAHDSTHREELGDRRA
ncbi:hypothetical protein Pcinc_038939, partial [Petrolisthes cinctipes]